MIASATQCELSEAPKKKKITGEGGATDTAPPMEQGPACIRTADRSLGAAMCFMES